MTARLGFARWRSELPSGGNAYDEALAAGLRASGLDVHEYPVTGPWPLPQPADRQRLAGLLESERHWLLGNIVASPVPDLIAAAESRGRRVTILVHYFPADDPDLVPAQRSRLAQAEERAIMAASTVVVTSRWAADTVAARYGRDDTVVARPGIEPAPRAPGSLPHGRAPALLWLGRVTRGKDPLTFVTALGRLRDLDWTARLVGPDTIDPALTRQVRDLVNTLGLDGRVDLLGSHRGPALAAQWDQTDLLVHTSRFETYGMVVAEALTRGIPSIVAAGTGAVEAQQAGGLFPPGDSGALALVLRDWLTDADLREGWRAAAVERRGHAPTWSETARIVADALAGRRW